MGRKHMDEIRMYEIPVSLLNDLILTIIGAILAIGAYMIIWAIHDAKHKVLVLTRLGMLEDLIKLHDTYRAEHDRYAQRVETLSARLNDHIERHRGD